MAAALDRCVPGADSQPRSDGRHDGLARAVTVAGTHNAVLRRSRLRGRGSRRKLAPIRPLSSPHRLVHAAVLGGTPARRSGKRRPAARGLWRVRRPCFGPVTVPSWSGSCGCGCVGRPWRHATSPPNTMLRSTPSAARSTASRNHSTFPCAPAAAPGPHRVEATPPKHVHIPEHVHILGRGIRRML